MNYMSGEVDAFGKACNAFYIILILFLIVSYANLFYCRWKDACAARQENR
jgi:hypothetical protein